MRSYKTKRRHKRIISIVIIAASMVAFAVGVYFFLPRDKQVAALPTGTLMPTVPMEPTASPVAPSPTPYPPGSTWDLAADGLAKWQLRILLSDLNQFWEAYMAPEGLMNCAAASRLISKADPAVIEGLQSECAKVRETGVFDTSLPLSKLALTASELSQQKRFVGLQLDTTREWPLEVRYLSDNGLKGIVTMERVIYTVILVYEDGMWRVTGLNTLTEGEDF